MRPNEKTLTVQWSDTLLTGILATTSQGSHRGIVYKTIGIPAPDAVKPIIKTGAKWSFTT